MKTKHSVLLPNWIKSDSLRTWWYKNGQMWWYMEMKDGKFHGDWKNWHSDGQLRWHYVYENGRLLKDIV